MSENLIFGCQITGIFDVNRNETLPDDDYAIVEKWALSVAKQGLKAVLFHNNFSARSIEKHQNAHLEFVEIDYDSRFKPNVFRYIAYSQYLKLHSANIANLFITDVADVELVCNPFASAFYLAHPDYIFCGDEVTTLQNDWMDAHSAHLRSKIADYSTYEYENKHKTLLNCGVAGGSLAVMHPFIDQLADLHERYNHDNQSAYTGDMGAFNYLLRTQYVTRIMHGAPVNTVFKGYETDRSDCWFRHK